MRLKNKYEGYIQQNESYAYITDDDIDKILYYGDKIKFFKWMRGQGVGMGKDGSIHYFICDVKQFINANRHWRTAVGEMIKYEDLTDGHLKNILIDGYRNKHLKLEAKSRGLGVPKKATLADVCRMREALSMCSEDNEYANDILELHDDHFPSFMVHCNRIMNRKFYD